jgi:hypothetical protein
MVKTSFGPICWTTGHFILWYPIVRTPDCNKARDQLGFGTAVCWLTLSLLSSRLYTCFVQVVEDYSPGWSNAEFESGPRGIGYSTNFLLTWYSCAVEGMSDCTTWYRNVVLVLRCTVPWQDSVLVLPVVPLLLAPSSSKNLSVRRRVSLIYQSWDL